MSEAQLTLYISLFFLLSDSEIFFPFLVLDYLFLSELSVIVSASTILDIDRKYLNFLKSFISVRVNRN